MVSLEIDIHSQIPLYQQIMDRLRALVRQGELPPSTPLPSVRQLAADLDINANTVAKAYRLLEREGLLTTARRRGTLVAPRARDAAHLTVDSRLEEAVDRVLETAASLGVERAELLEALRRRGRAEEDASSPRSSS